jgi:AcrR family transcriptional regulator
VRSALELMGRHGYDGVRMDEIGAAVGVSGSAVYRYFTTKSAILVAAFEQANDMAARTSSAALRDAASPRDAVRRLVSSYVTVAFANVDLITVTEREWRSLPPGHTSRLRRSARKEREVWVEAYGRTRPGLSRQQVEMLVESVQGLVNAAAQTDARKVNAPALAVRSGVTHLAWRFLGLADN